jgi:Putative prokaryotic signal transducing protein
MSTSAPHFVEVYLAANPPQAHLVRVLLERKGIRARVVGDLLQGGAGELPLGVASAPAIWVPDHEAVQAREIIEQWEADQRTGRHRQEPHAWACPKCGASVDESDTVCATCGRQLDDAAGEVSQSAEDFDASAAEWSPLVTNRRVAGAVVVFLLILAAAFVWWIRTLANQ